MQVVRDLGKQRMFVPSWNLIGLQKISANRESVVFVPTIVDRLVSFIKVYRLRLHREPSAVQRVFRTFAIRRTPSKYHFR